MPFWKLIPARKLNNKLSQRHNPGVKELTPRSNDKVESQFLASKD